MLKPVVLFCVLAASGSASAATAFNKSVPKSWKSDYVDYFEAGYTAYTGTTYTGEGAAGATGDKLAIDAKVTAWVRLFGNKSNIAEIRGEGYTRVDGARDYDVEIWTWLIGSKVRLDADDWNEDDGLILLENSLDWSFFSAEKRFYGVVKVKGSVKGQLGYSVAGVTTNSFIGARLTPYVRAYARFTASVDVFVAEAGAYGELNLITASVPIYGNMKATTGSCYTSDANMDATVTGLDGEAGVFYRLLWSSPREQELWSWDGVEKTTSLYDPQPISGCL
jgi:hypothetical protein